MAKKIFQFSVFSFFLAFFFSVLTPVFGQCRIEDRLFGRCYADGSGYNTSYAGNYRQDGPGTARQPIRMDQSYRFNTGKTAMVVDIVATGADVVLGWRGETTNRQAIQAQKEIEMAELENERIELEYKYGQRPTYPVQGTTADYRGNRGRVDPVPTSSVVDVPLEFGWVNYSCFYLKVYDGQNFVTILRPGEKKKISGPQELPQTDQGFVGYFLIPQGGSLAEERVLPDDNTFNAWVFNGEPCNR